MLNRLSQPSSTMNIFQQIFLQNLENQDPNNAVAPETAEARDCGDNEGTGNELEEEKKSFYVIKKVGCISHSFFLFFGIYQHFHSTVLAIKVEFTLVDRLLVSVFLS